VVGVSTETINMRTDAERKQRLQLAAELSHETLTGFVLSAAEQRAERVIAEARNTTLSGEFFDLFFSALVAEPTPALKHAAARLRQTVSRDQ
jgi:uncharacterized protein (DUF1778 family)